MSISKERSAEWLRGAIAVCEDVGQRIAAAIYRKSLASAEAREAGERIGESLLDRLRQDLPAIRYHLGGVGPEIKLALDDRSRQSNILVAIHALDALMPLLAESREATQPTAAEVIAACEKALEELAMTGRVTTHRAALALCARWKEAHGGK